MAASSETAAEWLERLRCGWAGKFAPAFAALGIELVPDDVIIAGPADLALLRDELQNVGCKPVQLRRICANITLLRDGDGAGAAATRSSPPALGHRRPAVAIVGMACRLPGGVASPAALAAFLAASGDGIVTVPSKRWPPRAGAAAAESAAPWRVAGIRIQSVSTTSSGRN